MGKINKMKFFLTFEEKCAKVKAFTNSSSSWHQPKEDDSLENRYLAYSLEAENFIGYKEVAKYFFDIAVEIRYNKKYLNK